MASSICDSTGTNETVTTVNGDVALITRHRRCVRPQISSVLLPRFTACFSSSCKRRPGAQTKPQSDHCGETPRTGQRSTMEDRPRQMLPEYPAHQGVTNASSCSFCHTGYCGFWYATDHPAFSGWSVRGCSPVRIQLDQVARLALESGTMLYDLNSARKLFGRRVRALNYTINVGFDNGFEFVWITIVGLFCRIR